MSILVNPTKVLDGIPLEQVPDGYTCRWVYKAIWSGNQTAYDCATRADVIHAYETMSEWKRWVLWTFSNTDYSNSYVASLLMFALPLFGLLAILIFILVITDDNRLLRARLVTIRMMVSLFAWYVLSGAGLLLLLPPIDETFTIGNHGEWQWVQSAYLNAGPEPSHWWVNVEIPKHTGD